MLYHVPHWTRCIHTLLGAIHTVVFLEFLKIIEDYYGGMSFSDNFLGGISQKLRMRSKMNQANRDINIAE